MDRSEANWVPLRENRASSEKSTHGIVSWRPNFIPLASHLEIDVVAFNRLCTAAQINLPIEIVSYHHPDDQEMLIGSVSRNGEITAQAKRRNSKLPQLSFIPLEKDQEAIRIHINFQGIDDYLKDKHQNLKSNEYYIDYGKIVDKAIRSRTLEMIFANFLNEAERQPGIFSEEILISAVSLLPSIATFAVLVTETLANNQSSLNLVQVASLSLLLNRCFYALSNCIQMFAFFYYRVKGGMLPDSMLNRYSEYVMDKMERSNFVPFFDAEHLTKFLTLPIIHAFLWKEPLVRGKP